MGETDFDRSHSEPVTAFRWETKEEIFVYNFLLLSWIGKTGTELFTGSEDSYVKWWDIR